MFIICAYRFDAKTEGLNMVKMRISLHACCNLTGFGGSRNSMNNCILSVNSNRLLIFVVPLIFNDFWH